MALPIKNTPILYGKEAKIFENKATRNINKKLNKKELKHILGSIKKLKSY